MSSSAALYSSLGREMYFNSASFTECHCVMLALCVCVFGVGDMVVKKTQHSPSGLHYALRNIPEQRPEYRQSGKGKDDFLEKMV